MIEQKLINRVRATEKERESWRRILREFASAERLVNGGFRSVNAGRLATAKL